MKDEQLQQKANFMHKMTFSSTNKKLNLDYADQIEESLKNYTLESSNFKVDGLGECGVRQYGLTSGKICVYLKLNRIWGWKPLPIDADDIMSAGEDWPEDFARHWESQDNKNFVWMSCKPKKDEDQEKFEDFEYFPNNRGINLKFFPFVKTVKVQLPPLVAVMITPNSRFEDETSVVIECRAFYKGKSLIQHYSIFSRPHLDVVHESKMGKHRGLVLFELIIAK